MERKKLTGLQRLIKLPPIMGRFAPIAMDRRGGLYRGKMSHKCANSGCEPLQRENSTGKIKRSNGQEIHLLENGRNVCSGEVAFNNTKTAYFEFPSTITFTKPPRVTITPLDSANAPHWKSDIDTTGVIIRCKTKWTSCNVS